MKNIILNFSLLLLLVSLSYSWPTLSTRMKKSGAEKTKQNVTAKDEEENNITEEEKRFLKEIEEKYNIKNDEKDEVVEMKKFESKKSQKVVTQAPLPAVIAIEIVNDTSIDGKGKRTIDANLGYGYKTNGGYVYGQFGKSNEQKGKFMIYPYSQHDIPPLKSSQHGGQQSNVREKTHVEILPSKAYQLIPINSNENEQSHNGYSVNEHISPNHNSYENVQAVQNPPPQYQSHAEPYSYPHPNRPTTLFSTYSGGQLSGLSGNFPIVMPNYFVSPQQILNHPHYQSLGLENSQEQEQLSQKRVIPIIILRIPSSHIQNPSAELYPKLPNTHPYAMSLNNINLQSIVSQYLQNIQPQYVAPTQETDSKYISQYSQPISYYQPQQPLYTVPTYSPLRYTHTQTPVQNYLPSIRPTYVHHPDAEHPSQPLQYVLPHPSASTNVPTATSHASFTQVYGNPTEAHDEPEYENSGEQSESLPFSENYPDSAHTRVIIPPAYAQGSSLPQQHPMHSKLLHYLPSSSPVGYQYMYLSHPQSHLTQQNDESLHGQQSVSSSEQDDYNEESNGSHEESESSAKLRAPSPSKVPPQGPYNYHAHSFLKRQTKSSDDKTKQKSTTRSRRLISDIGSA